MSINTAELRGRRQLTQPFKANVEFLLRWDKKKAKIKQQVMNIAGIEEYPPTLGMELTFLPTAAYTDSIKDSKEKERDYLQGHIKP